MYHRRDATSTSNEVERLSETIAFWLSFVGAIIRANAKVGYAFSGKAVLFSF
jgi:hypothetical protein